MLGCPRRIQGADRRHQVINGHGNAHIACQAAMWLIFVLGTARAVSPSSRKV